MRFHFWVLRAVPDVARGEFVNIGVLVGSADAGWMVKTPSSLSRAEELGVSSYAAHKWLEVIREAVHERRANYGWASTMCAICSQTHFQFSPPASIIAPDVGAAIAEVYAQKILDPGDFSAIA